MISAEIARRACAVLIGAASLSGCTAFSDVASTASAVASGAATGNPAVAIAVGGIVRAAIEASSQAYARSAASETQGVIVGIAGWLEPGDSETWHEVRHLTEDLEGRVEVLRVIDSPLAVCKEIAFTIVQKGIESTPYHAAICNTGEQWRWALAEPAIQRWGTLH